MFLSKVPDVLKLLQLHYLPLLYLSGSPVAYYTRIVAVYLLLSKQMLQLQLSCLKLFFRRYDDLLVHFPDEVLCVSKGEEAG